MAPKAHNVRKVRELIEEAILAGESFAASLEALADEMTESVPAPGPRHPAARLGVPVPSIRRSPCQDSADWVRRQAHDARKLCEALRRTVDETDRVGHPV